MHCSVSTSLLAFVFTMTTVSWRVRGGHPCSVHANGCSLPGNMNFFYKQTFTAACDRHDICYVCGALYGKDRHYCDQAFLQNMKQACLGRRRREIRILAAHHVQKRHLICTVFAYKYFVAVRLFGGFKYHSHSREHYCNDIWVSGCM